MTRLPASGRLASEKRLELLEILAGCKEAVER